MYQRRKKTSVYPIYETRYVFAAACAAQRFNGEYLKTNVLNEDGTEIVKRANKNLIHYFLCSPSNITEQDYELADEVIAYCRGILFKMITGDRISDFQHAMHNISNKESIQGVYDISLISSLPHSYELSQRTRTTQDRLDACTGFVAKVNDRVSIAGEVVRCRYNENYNVHFVTVITDDNKQVFFAYKSNLAVGRKLNVTGRVKAHRESATQLSYVKLV